MRHCWLLAVAAAILVCFVTPELAFAADAADAAKDSHKQGQPMDFNPVQFVLSLAVFGIAFFILGRLVWPKIIGGLEDRDNKIREEIFAAEEARQRANDALQEYEKSLAEARAEAAAMIESTKAEQSRLAAKYRQEAEEQRSEMLTSARDSIEAAKRAALNEIYNETAVLATAVASKILERELNPEDQRRLSEEALAEISSRYAGQNS